MIRKIISILAQNGADINTPAFNNETPLYGTALENHVQSAEALLKLKADFNIAETEDGWVPLHMAVDKKHYQIIDLLLKEKKVDVNIKDKYMITPLMLATKVNSTKIAFNLLELGAKVDAVEIEGRSSLWFAAIHGYFELVTLYVGQGADVDLVNNNKTSPIYVASQEGYLNIVKYLAENASANIFLQEIDGHTSLHIAAAHVHHKVVVYLALKGLDVNIESTSGDTALTRASYWGHHQVVMVLLKLGAKVNHRDKNGRTALLDASLQGHFSVVLILLNNNASVNIKSSDDYNATPLYAAAQENHFQIVMILVARGANINFREEEGRTPLWEASFDGHVEIVKYLLKEGADAELAHKGGATPLIVASQEGHLPVVKVLLLQGKAKINRKRLDGDTALYWAAINHGGQFPRFNT